MKLTIFVIFSLVKISYSARSTNQDRQLIVSAEEALQDFIDDVSNELPGRIGEVINPIRHTFCTALQTLNQSPPSGLNPDINDIKFILITSNGNLTVPIMDVKRLWNDSLFNQDWPTVIYIAGRKINLEKMQNDGVDIMAEAFLNRTSTNFIALDPSYYVDTIPYYASYNSLIIGKYVGQALSLLDVVYTTTKMHLIGYDLGVHIAGVAGREYTKETGKLLSRVTGLESSAICFQDHDKFFAYKYMNKNAASFVDVVHTTNGVEGRKYPVGHIDFYANGDSTLQPGCKTIPCSHFRAILLFVETVYQGHEYDLPGVQCKNYSEMTKKQCFGKQVPMGYATPYDARGIYLFKTKSSSPYGNSSN